MEVPGGMNGLQFTIKTVKDVGSEVGALVKATTGGISHAAKWTGSRVSDIANVAAWSVGGIASNAKKAISGAGKSVIKKPFDIAAAGVVSAASVAAVGLAANHSRAEAAKDAADAIVNAPDNMYVPMTQVASQTAGLGGKWVNRMSEPATVDLGSETPSQPTR